MDSFNWLYILHTYTHSPAYTGSHLHVCSFDVHKTNFKTFNTWAMMYTVLSQYFPFGRRRMGIANKPASQRANKWMNINVNTFSGKQPIKIYHSRPILFWIFDFVLSICSQICVCFLFFRSLFVFGDDSLEKTKEYLCVACWNWIFIFLNSSSHCTELIIRREQIEISFHFGWAHDGRC